MEGAASNQTLKCIIYYNNNNYKKAQQKLKEIIEEKLKNGINMIYNYESNYISKASFSDKEEWITVNAGANSKAYRWRKAYVDCDISQEVIEKIIAPCGNLYKWEDYKKY